MHMVVDGLLDYMDAFLAENSRNLRRRPVFVYNHLLNATPQCFRLAVITFKPMLACIRFYLGIAPYIFTIRNAEELQVIKWLMQNYGESKEKEPLNWFGKKVSVMAGYSDDLKTFYVHFCDLNQLKK